MTSQKPEGVPIWLGVIGSIVVAVIGAYATIEASKISHDNSNKETVTIPSSTPSLSTNPTSISNKNCSKITSKFVQQFQPFTNTNAPPISGLVVTEIIPGYSDESLGLQNNDIIYAVNGEPIINSSTLSNVIEDNYNKYITLAIYRVVPLNSRRYDYYNQRNSQPYNYYNQHNYQPYNVKISIKKDCPLFNSY